MFENTKLNILFALVTTGIAFWGYNYFTKKDDFEEQNLPEEFDNTLPEESRAGKVLLDSEVLHEIQDFINSENFYVEKVIREEEPDNQSSEDEDMKEFLTDFEGVQTLNEMETVVEIAEHDEEYILREIERKKNILFELEREIDDCKNFIDLKIDLE